MIKLSYDKEGDLLEIKFSEESIAESEYIEDSGIVIDYDQHENMVGIEVMSFSKRTKQHADYEVLAG